MEKEPKKFNFVERRKEILDFIIKAGHPRLINQLQLAKRYGVSQPQISQDLKKISKDIKTSLGDEAEFVTSVVYENALKNLMSGSNKEKYMAAKLVKEWNDWLFDVGVKQKAPERIAGELDGTVKVRWLTEKEEKERLKKKKQNS